MSRKFKTANYEETLKQTIRLAEALPPQHLVRFVVDIIAHLDLSKIYARYAPVGGIAFSTTGRGLLSGRFGPNTVFPPDDLRSLDPLFQRERFASGLRVADRLAQVGAKYARTPAQTAIAWALAQPGIVCALTGPSSSAHLEENLGASGWRIPATDLAEFEAFLERETGLLRQTQRATVERILASPLPQDASQAFVDLVYALETAIQLGVIQEADGMPIFRDLFRLRGAQGQEARRQLAELQKRLHELV